ncbi:MAG: Dabb family protein [Flavobacteriaceae bacterium]
MKKTLLIFTFLIISIASYGQEQQNMNNFDPAFVHTVFFWLNNPESDADRASFETALSKFLKTSDYAKTNFIGTPPKATRDVVDGSFTYSLVVTFESAEAQQKYQEEPAHLLFIEEASSLWNKVIVYDSQGIVK